MKLFLLKLAGKLLLPVLLLVMINNSQAQTGPGIVLKKMLDGAEGQLVKDSAILVQDSIYFNAGLGSKLDTPYKVRNIVTFRINEYSSLYLPDTFRATVNVRIYYTLPDLEIDSIDRQLTIHYDTANAYAVRSSFVFNNSHRVEVKVLDVTTTGSRDVLPVLQLENEMEVHPVYKLSCTEDAVKSISSNNPPITDTTDEVLVTWPVTVGANVYDLEWAYIDSSVLLDHRYGNPLNAALVFENNTTRVTIPGNSYAIPLLYDNGGILYFRVRAVQEKADYSRLETAWSSDFSGGLGSYSFCGHERNLNWQSSISFAEDGKRKVVVQYFDGSLRNRQTVTKDNTTNTTVVSESFYDYQGRPVIQVLPAPTISNVLKYTANLNPAMNGAEYDKSNYDQINSETEFLTASAKPMSTSSGANRYYSPANPDKDNGMSRFIPDAEGFAFTETQYTQDNTGRIAREGGVGTTFQLGSGHETKYYYATPSQEDLDALFGTEAGLNSHYFKNMVSDANGQHSVTYLDMHGRTIATALAGSPSKAELDDLPTKEVIMVTDSLSGAGKNLISDLKMESHKSHLVTQDGWYHFAYQLTPPVLQKPDCNDSTICYKGMYDLQVRITDDAYNLRLGGKPFDTTLHNYDSGAVVTDCSTPEPITLEFDIYLEKGSYEIVKTLTVSKQGMDFYRDSIFLQSNVCTTLEQMIEEQRLLQQNDNCFPDCQSCLDSLGTFEAFREKYVLDAGNELADTAVYSSETWAAYQRAVTSCDEICGTTTEIDEIRLAMLQDVTGPSGQYATVSNSNSVYSIFYHPDENTIPPYARSTVDYVDEAGRPASVLDDRTNMFVSPQKLTAEQFADKFQDSWAPALLKFHPEYCKLLELEKYRSSLVWDKGFEATDTYAEAKQAGYLNPTGIAGMQFPAGSDPLAAQFASQINAKLNNYSNNLSTWSLATIMAKCLSGEESCKELYDAPAESFNEGTMCEGDLNMAWRNFRGFYLNIKKEIINAQIAAASCPGASLQDLTNNAKFSHFNNGANMMASAGYGELASGNMTPYETQVMANAAQQQAFADNCKAYVELWRKQLSSCYDSAALAEIIPQLEMVCREGSDTEHPRGASTVRPSSTHRHRNFQDVLNDYNSRHPGIDRLQCNALLITAPKAYGKEPAYSDKPSYTRPDECECGKLSDLEREYDALKRPEDADFSAYLLRTRKVSIPQSELNVLLDACSSTGGGCNYLPKPIMIPALIQCQVAPACVNCEEVNGLYNTFTAFYPGMEPSLEEVDSTQLLKNEMFANFMNSRLGFAKQAWEYLAFMDSCENATPTGSLTICRPGGESSKQQVSTYSHEGTDVITDIQRTADNGYILAGSTTASGSGGKDGYLIKTDSKGTLIWSKTYGAEQDDAFVRLKRTTDSGFIAIGNTYSYCYDRGAILIAKLDKDGNLAWNKVIDFGETHGGRGNDIIQLANGKFAFAGLRTITNIGTDWITGVLEEDGELSWMRRVGSAAARKTISLLENNDTLLATTAIMDANDYDAVVIKQNKHNGAFLDFAQYDLEGRGNIAGNILKTPAGYKLAIVNLADGANPAGNGVLMDINTSGDVSAASKISSAGDILPEYWSVSPALDGGYYASQSTQDVYWHKLRADNSIQWSRQVRTMGTDRLTRILQDPGGSIAGAGLYNDELSMLMQATVLGKTGCSDTAVDMTSTDITSVSIRKTMAAQSDSVLLSNCISTVNLVELAHNPVRVALNCPGLDSCYIVGGGPILCGNAEPVFAKVDLDAINGCSDSTFFAVSAGKTLYKLYVDSVKNDFDVAYLQMALQAASLEKFSMTYESSEYHYTLYYYDQAGNLIKTVPPAGVIKRREKSWTDSVAVARATGERLVPPHTMPTNYRYNTLNQVTAQKTPDAGESHFWYDRLGRLVASQNAKQMLDNHYSYTIYDDLGRITEVGEITSATAMTDLISRKAIDLAQWTANASGTKTQITKTVYDLPHTPFDGLVWYAKNLRNRVSWSAVYNTAADLSNGNRASGTFYSYDIHGNVKTLVQDYNPGTALNEGNRFKKIEYEYDLISGKVNLVSYQPGQADAFYHRYQYDAENRITNVETSTDSVYWENDAYYQYYKHGPLGRTVLGQQQVQGLDYAYTLQGWLKGMNSTAASPEFDLGQDGSTGGITAKDAFGFALHYFGNEDYKPINSSVNAFAGIAGANKPLYNGNISAMSVNVPKVGNPMLYQYKYDVLNRLKGMQAEHGLNASSNVWTPVSVDDFSESVTYDPNGNILTYKRNGNNTWAGSPLNMDKLTYHYDAGTNKLNWIHDSVPSGNYDVDIDAQEAGNYAYDAIGNLISDTKDSLLSIEWTVYGKIKRIIKANGTVIDYTYDASGNRLSKNVSGVETRYIRDASGNVMSIYVSGDASLNGGELSQREVHLYGSNRLGILNRSLNVQNQTSSSSYNLGNLGAGFDVNFVRGEKFFELSNHLGNVLATVKDTKEGVSSDGNVVDYYLADVVSAQDYYPFGMLQVGRSFSVEAYRYGFNGKENDNEEKGEGNQIDYGMRVYDPRIGRFLSVDPLTKSFPMLTPYQYASNSPIANIDLDGLESVYVFGTAEYFLGVFGHEVTLGLAIDKHGIAIGGSYGGKFGIGVSGTAGGGLTVFPTMDDLQNMSGRGDAVNFSGAFLGSFGVSVNKSGDYIGGTVTYGVGAGAQLSYTQSWTALSRTYTWDELSGMDPKTEVNGVQVGAVLELYGLNPQSTVAELKKGFLGRYESEIFTSIEVSIQEVAKENTKLSDVKVANTKALNQLNSKKELTAWEKIKKYTLEVGNKYIDETIKKNNEEIKKLESQRDELKTKSNN